MMHCLSRKAILLNIGEIHKIIEKKTVQIWFSKTVSKLQDIRFLLRKWRCISITDRIVTHCQTVRHTERCCKTKQKSKLFNEYSMAEKEPDHDSILATRIRVKRDSLSVAIVRKAKQKKNRQLTSFRVHTFSYSLTF